MNKILDFILSYCSFLYESFKFKFIDSGISDSFGGQGYLILANDEVELQFINDKQQLFLTFHSKYDNNNEWYSIDLIRQLLFPLQIDYSLMDESNAKFLRENFEELLPLFSKINFKNTLERLERLKDERTDRLFGPIDN